MIESLPGYEEALRLGYTLYSRDDDVHVSSSGIHDVRESNENHSGRATIRVKCQI